ncbi:MAG: hypothetical protein HQL24_07755 [Candidatus Omnitrophica bacterium]|nr:hypothetical protein [Candidatus Omnitrophota bacterium]
MLNKYKIKIFNCLGANFFTLARECALFIPSFGIPLFLFWIRTRQVTCLPLDDSGDYLKTVLDIINSAKHDGGDPVAWIYNAYIVRGWRPVLLPVVALPLFAFFPKAPLLLLLNCYSAIVLFLILFFLRKLLQDFLTPLELCVTLLLVGTLPWVNRSMLIFMCEPLFILTSVITVYYVYRSKSFTLARYSFLAGLGAGLAFAIRPVEAILVLMPAGLIFLGLCLREKKIPSGALFICLPSLGVLVLSIIYCVLIYPARAPLWMLYFLTCSAFVLAILLWIASIKSVSWRGWISFYAAAFSIIVLWDLPFIRAIYGWAHHASFEGPPDSMFSFKPGQGFAFILTKFWTDFFSYSMSVFLFLGLVAVIMWFVARDRTRKIPEQAYWMVAIFGSIFIHPFIASFANDNTSRVYQVEALVLALMSLVVMLRLRNNIFPVHKVGVFLIVIVSIFHCTVTLSECGHLGRGVLVWNRKDAKKLSPSFSEIWNFKEKWYESELYASLIEQLPNPGHGLKALVIEPNGLYAQRFAIKAARSGVMTKIISSALKMTKAIKESDQYPYDWILAGPFEAAEFVKAPKPNFMPLVQEFERNFHPQTIVMREGGRSATFLFWIKGFAPGNSDILKTR